MSIYLPTPQDFANAPKGQYFGEYVFFRIDAEGRRTDGSGKIVFGEMLATKYSGPDGGGTVEGEFAELQRDDEAAFFMDFYCIIQVFLRPFPPEQWKEIIRTLRFERPAKEPYLGWMRIPPPSNRVAAKLQFFFRANGIEQIVGYIRDPHDTWADMFWDVTVQLDLMFKSVPASKARQIERRTEFYRRLADSG